MLDLIHELLKIAGSHPELKELAGVKVAERFLKEQAVYDYKEDSYSAKATRTSRPPRCSRPMTRTPPTGKRAPGRRSVTS